jgi:hypothetical protein
MFVDPIISIIASFVIGGLFLLSGVHKAQNQSVFRYTLANYGIPQLLLLPAGIVITSMELLIAILILLSIIGLVNIGMMLGLGLLVVYTGLLSTVYLTGRSFDCGCNFGGSTVPIGGWHIARNLILIAVAALYFLPQAGREIFWLDYLSAITATLMITLTLIIIETMKSNNAHFSKSRETI